MEHVAHVEEMSNAHKILVGKPDHKRSPVRPRQQVLRLSWW